MSCCSYRKFDYIFEHGTVVSASDYSSAIVKLHKVDESRFTIEEVRKYLWVCEFSKDVRIEFECPSHHKAQMQGPWLLHLDKRLVKN